MKKILEILSTTPATIITTIIVLALLIAFLSYVFKDFIIAYIKKKFSLFDTKDVYAFLAQNRGKFFKYNSTVLAIRLKDFKNKRDKK